MVVSEDQTMNISNNYQSFQRGVDFSVPYFYSVIKHLSWPLLLSDLPLGKSVFLWLGSFWKPTEGQL